MRAKLSILLLGVCQYADAHEKTDRSESALAGFALIPTPPHPGTPAAVPTPVGSNAEPLAKHHTSGPAFLAGVGYQSPVVGAQADYYWIPSTLPAGVAGYAGAAWFPPTDVTDNVRSRSDLGLAFGLMVFVGEKHRAFLDASYGVAAIKVEAAGTVVVNQDTAYGLTGAAGYEFASRGGFLLRGSIGITHIFEDLSPGDRHTSPTLNLAVGYKLF